MLAEPLDESELPTAGAAERVDPHECAFEVASIGRLRLRAASDVEYEPLQTGETAECVRHLPVGD